MYREEKRILQKAYETKKLVFFVGAGCSTASGLPRWKTLVDDIAMKVAGDFNKEDHLKVPQYYYNARGEKEYNELIFELLDYKNKKPNSIHEKIIGLGTNIIITTNYDDLIEKEAANQGYFFDVIAKDKDLPYCKSDKQIIKMHGDFGNKNFVLKEDDYLNYDTNFKLIKTQIQSLFAKNVILFVGFSYDDFNVKMIFEWVRNILGNDFQKAYLLQINGQANPLIKEYFKNRGINIIYANNLPITKTADSELELRTRKALDYLFDKNDDRDIIETIYPKLEILDVFNCVHHKQLLPALIYNKKTTSYIDGDGITFKDQNLAQAIYVKLKSFDANRKLLISIFNKSNIRFLNFPSIKKEQICLSAKDDNEDNELFEIIKYPDWQMRDNYIKILSRETSVQNSIKKAYIYFLLEDYSLARKELIDASKQALKENQLIWFYISEFNRFYLSKSIFLDYQQNDESHISVNIDLDKTLDKIISTDSYYRTALKDLNNWSVFYNTIKDANSIRRKTTKEANTVYAIYAGTPAIVKLKAIAKNTYDFVTKNFLCVTNYNEVISVFITYAESLLYSLSKPEITSDEGLFGFHSSNIVSVAIDEFDLQVLLEYIDLDQIKDFINSFEIDKMSITNEAEQYLLKLIQCLENNMNAARFSRENYIFLNKIFYLCGHIHCSEGITAALVRFYGFAFAENFMDHNNDKNFMIFLSRNKIKDECLIKLMHIFLDKFLSTDKKEQHDKREKFLNMFSLFSNLNYKITDKKYESLIDGAYIEYMLTIYKILSAELKASVKKYINNQLANSKISVDIYTQAILYDVAVPSSACEEKLYQLLQKNIESKLKKIKASSSPYDYYVGMASKLFLNKKLINKERFIPFFTTIPSSAAFIYDMDNFDYNNFDLEWLCLYPKGTLLNVSKNRTAKKNIQELYKKALLNNSLNKKHKEIFMEYFI